MRRSTSTSAEYKEFYLGFCNGTLWPLFHYFVDGFRYDDTQYEAYLRMNQRYARVLLPLLEADDLIWVHDYHLFPLAQRLREGGATQPIGLFLHIPFPNIEVLRALPVYGELLQAMLAYDVLGFQTETDRDAFRSAVAFVWGAQVLTTGNTVTFGGRSVITEVFPIGVDVETIQREAVESQGSDDCKRMTAGLLGRKLMIGVDRLDYSKGLVERFKAYERFLETHPENQNRVTFMQIAPLSRADVRAYADIRRELEQTTGRTNGRFADTDWTPIRYLNRNFPHDVLMGFMRSALIGIVTPVRDGMNLVAKEFVAAQDAGRSRRADPVDAGGRGARAHQRGAWSTRMTRAAWRMPSSRRSTCRWRSGASGTTRCSRSCGAIPSRRGTRVSSRTLEASRTPRLKRRTG